MPEPEAKGLLLKVKFEGDTSDWDAEDQLRAAHAIIKRLKAIERGITGKPPRIKWVIMGMEMDETG